MVVTKNVSIMFGVFKENKEKPLLRKNIAITKHDFLAKKKDNYIFVFSSGQFKSCKFLLSTLFSGFSQSSGFFT